MNQSFSFSYRLVAFFLFIVLLVPTGPAFAWHNVLQGSTKIHSFPTNSFSSYNTGAYSLLGIETSECGSNMYIRVDSGNTVSPGSVQAQALITRGVLVVMPDYPYTQVNEVTDFGLRTFNTMALTPGSALLDTISSSCETTLKKAAGFGDIGAYAWGLGQITCSGETRDITPDFINLITTDQDGYYVPFTNYAGSNVPSEWIVGSSNFIGTDGQLYGVPFYDETDTLILPDMCRVEFEPGEFGYVSFDEIEAVTLCYAETDEQRAQTASLLLDQEACAIQNAFKEYYGVDALGHDTALLCTSILRYENGYAIAAETMESAIKEYVFSEYRTDKSLDELRNGKNLEVEKEDIDAMIEIAKPQLTVSVPVYSGEDMSVIGSYSFLRL